MRPSAVLTLAWLPLVLLYTDQGASALPPDSLVQIRLSQASKTCSPPVTTTRSVRFYSVKTAGGSLYVRHLFSQDSLDCYQAGGGAVNETARDFATCANTAEKKKKNMFQFVNGVCTSYAAMPPSALLPSCSGVGVAVIYVVKTALNSATRLCPVPKVTNILLTANPTSITAAWTVQDESNLTQSYMVTVQTFGSILLVSSAGVNITNNASSVSTVIIPAGVMTYEIFGVIPCSNTCVTVTPQYSDGKDNGTSMTVSTLEMTPGTTTTPSFDSAVYSAATLDSIIRTWHFRGCESIASYKLSYLDGDALVNMPLATSVTSIVVLGNEVCGGYRTVIVDAVDTTGTKLASSGILYPFGVKSTNLYQWPTQNACFNLQASTMNFTDALAYCSTVRRGRLFSYGGAYYSNLTAETENIAQAWVDLRYSPTTSQWVWGNGEVEPVNSTNWAITPDPSLGHCATMTVIGRKPMVVDDCAKLNEVSCFKFY